VKEGHGDGCEPHTPCIWWDRRGGYPWPMSLRWVI
jgi:hypothetical protein